jgi:very-short-patch-repair endonuclease
MSTQAVTQQTSKAKLTQIFKYLKALSESRHPIVADLRDQRFHMELDQLPLHSSIAFSRDLESESILTAERPKLTKAPHPPGSIREWLSPRWSTFGAELSVLETRIYGEGRNRRAEKFTDSEERVRDLERYREERNRWAESEKPARASMQVFEELYELWALLQKENEQFEFLIGDGHLVWDVGSCTIHHPLVLKRIQLLFNSQIPEFKIVETDQPVELYSNLLSFTGKTDGKMIGSLEAEAQNLGVHPLEDENTGGYLRGLVVRLDAHGSLVQMRPEGVASEPVIYRSPVLFLRKRSLGFSAALKKILDDIPSAFEIAPALENVVGLRAVQQSTTDQSHKTDPCGSNSQQISESKVLFSKPANTEQYQIAARLEQANCVLVQGPPGTGKTHTIANLLGHLLAQGKSVLVTSHTAKALRVVREQVVPELQPLCVSVLGSDLEERALLEASIAGIVDRLTSGNSESLRKEALRLEVQRDRYLSELRELKQKLIEICSSEYKPIIFGGEQIDSISGAKFVVDHSEDCSWIPSPVSLGSPLPLSVAEISELYATNAIVSGEEEKAIDSQLPNEAELQSPQWFNAKCDAYEGAQAASSSYDQQLWVQDSAIDGTETALENVLSLIRIAVELFDEKDIATWKLEVIEATRRSEAEALPWRTLLAQFQEYERELAASSESIYKYNPEVPTESPETQLTVVEEILTHLHGGASLSALALIIRPRWKNAIASWKVLGQPPAKTSEFESIRKHLSLFIKRQSLIERWNRQLAKLGAPKLSPDDQPERVLAGFIKSFGECLAWNASKWNVCEAAFRKAGLNSQLLLNEKRSNVELYGELKQRIGALKTTIPQAIESKKRIIEFATIKNVLDEYIAGLEKHSFNGQIKSLIDGAKTRDRELYEKAYTRIVELQRKSSYLSKRRTLLGKLEKVAPGWAIAIRERAGVHQSSDVPGNVVQAWKWRQLNDSLQQRHSLDSVTVQRQIEKLEKQLRDITAELIDRRSWAAQLSRIGVTEQQALMGWASVIRRIGKGTGKRASVLLEEAKRLMSLARQAVPVWIMPLARVVENFDPRTAKFDVVILDEASQCDLMGLIALYMGRQAVVVGDHEQVSPDAVGQDVGIIQQLIDSHLSGIPNAALYDGVLSIYELAQQSFGGLIALREHFRCVPDIINFSNHLSYGNIRPLRDSQDSELSPAVVPFRVSGTRLQNGVNTPEAQWISSLLAACLEEKSYRGKTFGVVSLVGDEQAYAIEETLRRFLNASELDKRRLVVGNAAQFQGDERDVVFLSLVDVPNLDGGPLALRSYGARDMFKKRFNVAASRAKDQMWVVYSLDPERDLKPEDLRRRLIRHALDPSEIQRLLESGENQVDSPFEKEIYDALVKQNFRVKCQWKAGFYSIDLVVLGAGSKKIAIECDGDRYHTQDRLAEDLARQAVLERMGWKFIRIRGSEFYRAQEQTIESLLKQLAHHGISPIGPDTSVESTNESGLLERVKNRAAQIYADNFADSDDESVLGYRGAGNQNLFPR